MGYARRVSGGWGWTLGSCGSWLHSLGETGFPVSGAGGRGSKCEWSGREGWTAPRTSRKLRLSWDHHRSVSHQLEASSADDSTGVLQEKLAPFVTWLTARGPGDGEAVADGPAGAGGARGLAVAPAIRDAGR